MLTAKELDSFNFMRRTLPEAYDALADELGAVLAGVTDPDAFGHADAMMDQAMGAIMEGGAL